MGQLMLTFVKKLMFEPALFFGFSTAVFASAAGFWSNDILAFVAAALAIGGGFVTRSQTKTKKYAATIPNGFVELGGS